LGRGVDEHGRIRVKGIKVRGSEVI
jgi:hypothetical protein